MLPCFSRLPLLPLGLPAEAWTMSDVSQEREVLDPLGLANLSDHPIPGAQRRFWTLRLDDE